LRAKTRANPLHTHNDEQSKIVSISTGSATLDACHRCYDAWSGRRVSLRGRFRARCSRVGVARAVRAVWSRRIGAHTARSIQQSLQLCANGDNRRAIGATSGRALPNRRATLRVTKAHVQAALMIHSKHQELDSDNVEAIASMYGAHDTVSLVAVGGVERRFALIKFVYRSDALACFNVRNDRTIFIDNRLYVVDRIGCCLLCFRFVFRRFWRAAGNERN
jgi:hypothetical protein